MSTQSAPILITGASSGIGQALSIALARRGFSVILLGRSQRGLGKTHDTILSEGGDAWIYPINLGAASPEDYAELASLIQEKWGYLRGLIHNAALFKTLTPLEHYAPPQWYEVMQVNLHAPFLLTQACLPLLKKAGRSSVLFSMASRDQLGAYWGAYAVSKQALKGLASVLEAESEVNTGIEVALIEPPTVNTPLRRQAWPGDLESIDRLPTANAEQVLSPFLAFF